MITIISILALNPIYAVLNSKKTALVFVGDGWKTVVPTSQFFKWGLHFKAVNKIDNTTWELVNYGNRPSIILSFKGPKPSLIDGSHVLFYTILE